MLLLSRMEYSGAKIKPKRFSLQHVHGDVARHTCARVRVSEVEVIVEYANNKGGYV